VVHWQDGEFADVISEMRAAIAVNPNYAEAYYLLGTAFKQSGQRGEAIAALKEAIRLNPNTPGPFTLLGQILRASGDAEGSRQAFAEAGRIKKQKESEQKTMFDRAVMETVGPAAGMRMDRKP
jgi:cytochrome c-type biogenesis protein CcmH/NrfG